MSSIHTFAKALKTAAIITLAVTACDHEQEEFALSDAEAIEQRDGPGDGVIFNTNIADGEAFSRVHYDSNDVGYVGAWIEEIRLSDGTLVQGIDIVNGRLTGTAYVWPGIVPVSDLDFIDSEWTIAIFAFPSYKEVNLKLTAYAKDGNVGYWDHMKFIDLATNQPTCSDEGSLVNKRWVHLFDDFAVDEQTGDVTSATGAVTFACRNGAMGKSLAMGWSPYRPQNGRNRYEAGIRAIRADYCGTGESFTVAGTPIDVADDLGITSFSNPGAATEAGYHEGGASCISASTARDGGALPSCTNGLPACPANPLNDPGALIGVKLP